LSLEERILAWKQRLSNEPLILFNESKTAILKKGAYKGADAD